MNKLEEHILKDMKACIERCLIEGKFEEAIVKVGTDASAVMVDKRAPRQTAGEFGRLVIPTGLRI